MFKSSMSVSLYSIARFLNFYSQKQKKKTKTKKKTKKNKTERFIPLLYAMNEMNWWPCNCLKSTIYLSKHYKIYYR